MPQGGNKDLIQITIAALQSAQGTATPRTGWAMASGG
jgi:hypothetical protein